MTHCVIIEKTQSALFLEKDQCQNINMPFPETVQSSDIPFYSEVSNQEENCSDEKLLNQ